MNRLEKRQLKPHWLQRRRRLLGGEEAGGFAGGGIPEAPLTGGPFGRYMETWVEVPPEAPKDSQTYGRNNDAWVVITGGGGGSAATVTFAPAGNISATNVQAALVELDNEKVAKAGDTMTGHLTLPTSPAAANAVRKDYVDSGDSTNATAIGLKVAKAGDTMTGFLVLHADPDANMKASTKQYVDTKFASVAGGAVIADTAPVAAQGKLWWESDAGGLWLSYNDGNTTQWIGVGGNVAQGNYVSKAGDTITGNISITSPTASGTPTSGALVVTGGVGIGGALNIAGAVNHNSTTQLGGNVTLFYSSPSIIFDRPAIANNNAIYGKVAGLNKWAVSFGDSAAMSGGNAGANFAIYRYADTTGSLLDTPLAIYRDTGRVVLASNVASTSPTTGALTVNGGVGIGGQLRTGSNVYVSGMMEVNNPSGGPSISLFSPSPREVSMSFYQGTVSQYTMGMNTSDGDLIIAAGDFASGTAVLRMSVNGSVKSTLDLIAGGSLIWGSNGAVGPGVIYSDINWGMLVQAKTASPALYHYGFRDAAGSLLYSIDANGSTHVRSGLSASSSSTGALVVDGGVGIAEHLHVAYSATVYNLIANGPGYPAAIISSKFAGAANYGITIDDKDSVVNSMFAYFLRASSVSLGAIVNANNSSVAYNTTSDERLKPNRERLKLDSARGIIDSLEVYDYDKEGNEIRGIGLIAQQAYATHKSLATPATEMNDVWMLEKAAPMPFVIANLQLLNKLVDQLMKAR